MKIFLASAALAIAASSAGAATLLNGSFETGPAGTSSFTTVGAGGTSITGWTVTSGNVDYIRTYWQSADGTRSLDMTGNRAGAIAQTVSDFIVGKYYALRFTIAGNPDGNATIKATPKQVRVGFGGLSQDFSFDTTSTTRNQMGWVDYSMILQAQSSQMTISFASLNNGFHGVALDNVRLEQAPSPVPLPASGLALLLGLGGLAALRRKRRV